MTPEETLLELLNSIGTKTAADPSGTALENNKPLTDKRMELHDGDVTPSGSRHSVDNMSVYDKVSPADDHTSGVLEEERKTREGILGRAFTGFDHAANVARATMSKNFKGPYVTDAPLLSKRDSAKAPEKTASLMERVRKLTGRI